MGLRSKLFGHGNASQATGHPQGDGSDSRSVGMERALRFVPVAVLTAIFLPEMVYIQEELMLSYRNPRLLAGLLAIVVAWRTKNVMYTILVGMLALWLLQFIFK